MSTATLAHLGLKQETTFGVKVVPDVFLEIIDESIEAEESLIRPMYVGGGIEQKRAIQGIWGESGAVNFDLTPEDAVPWILKGVFGQVSSALVGGSTGAYDHTFTPLQSETLPSFTVETDKEAMNQLHVGTTFSSFSFSGAPNETVGASVNAFSQTVDIGDAPQTPSFTTLYPFSYSHIAITLDGSSDGTLESLNFEYNRNVEVVHTLNNSRLASKHTAKNLTLNGSFARELANDDTYAKFLGSLTATSPESNVYNGSLTITITHDSEIESGFPYKFTVTIPRIVYSLVSAPISGQEDRLIETVAWTALKQAGSEICTVVMRNSVSSYA